MSTHKFLPSRPSRCRMLWDGYRWRISEVRSDRFFLVDSDGSDTHRELLHADIPALVKEGTLIIEEDFFNDDGSIVPQPMANTQASGMLDDERYYCHLMVGYMRQLDVRYKEKSVKLHAKSLEANFMGPEVDKAARHYAMTEMGWLDSEGKKPRKGVSRIPAYNPPGSSDLKRMYQKYRLPGFAFTDFRLQYDRCNQGGKRLAPYVQAVSENAVLEFHADERRMKIEPLRRYIGALLNDNKPKGEWTIKPPSHGAIKRIIEQMERHKIIGAQHGAKEMENETGSWTAGPTYTQAGEMVYLDCYKTDLVVHLQRAGIWMTFERKTRRLLASLRRRVWICVAIDAATRVVLGVSFGLAESAELAVRTLRMAMSDKSQQAIVAKCGAQPPRPLRPAGINTDSGSAFRAKRFRTVAYNVTGNVQIGVVGVARHRGIIERLFRTLHDQLISYFTGRVFSNIIERGDYDPLERLQLFLEDFGNVVFRWICDCYHLQAHKGLKDQPPINCFNEAIAETGYAPPMNSDQLRISFGHDLERRLTPLGITVAGIQYSANWLGERFKRCAGEKMRIKVDPENMGRISVLVDGQWATLVGPPEVQGIPLSFLLAQNQAIARKHGEQAQVNFEILAKALLSFGKLSAEARCQGELEDRSYSSKSLELADQKVKLRYIYRPRPSTHGGPLQVTQAAANGYRTGAKLSFGGPTKMNSPESEADQDDVLELEEDEDAAVQPTVDDVMSADNDNTAEDALPDDVLLDPVPKSKPVLKSVMKVPQAEKSSADLSQVISQPRNKIKRAAGES